MDRRPTGSSHAGKKSLALTAAAERTTQRQGLAQVADRRARFFTLAVERYRAVRRAAQYLPWALFDADVLVPSLDRKHARRPAVVRPPDAPCVAEPSGVDPNGGVQ